MDKTKLILPICILLGCIILGGFVYASQLNKQQSIERQQGNIFDLQAKCTSQAQQIFDNFKSNNSSNRYFTYSGYTYQFHFNHKMNKCFVLIGYDDVTKSDDGDHEDYLLDAFENDHLASCIYLSDLRFAPNCLIGSEKSTIQEYLNFINQRLETELDYKVIE